MHQAAPASVASAEAAPVATVAAETAVMEQAFNDLADASELVKPPAEAERPPFRRFECPAAAEPQPDRFPAVDGPNQQPVNSAIVAGAIDKAFGSDLPQPHPSRQLQDNLPYETDAWGTTDDAYVVLIDNVEMANAYSRSSIRTVMTRLFPAEQCQETAVAIYCRGNMTSPIAYKEPNAAYAVVRDEGGGAHVHVSIKALITSTHIQMASARG